MPRRARHIFIDIPHHLTQRGNYRQPVFFTDDDYLSYLELLWQYSVLYRLEIWAYCLMPNHMHLIAVPHNCGILRAHVGRGAYALRAISAPAIP